MLSYSTARLDNGLSVVSVEQPHLHSASVSLLVRCGSRHEGVRQWGLSHLLEHMLYRGSSRFPDSMTLAQQFERSGGSLEAATWRDHTSFTTACHPSYLKTVLGALGDMVLRPLFSDLNLEKSIVGEELQADLDEEGQDADPHNISRSQIWRGHPMGRRITGSPASLDSFSVDDIAAHHREHYVASNAVLCVAGPVRAAQVEDLAARSFGDMRQGSPTVDGDAARFKPRSALEMRGQPGTQLAIQLTFEALPATHQDFSALVLLTSLLDSGIGSRLQQAVCERKGLVYELSTGLDCYADCGVYDIEMKVAPRRAATAIATALEALQDLCDNGVGEQEIEVARERSLHELEFSIDSSEELATQYGTSTLFAQPEPLEVAAARIAAVQPTDILRVARQVFMTRRAHTTLVGPVERANVRRIERILEGFEGFAQGAE